MSKAKKETVKEEDVIQTAPPVEMPTSYTKFENGKQQIIATEDLKEEINSTIEASAANTVTNTVILDDEDKKKDEGEGEE